MLGGRKSRTGGQKGKVNLSMSREERGHSQPFPYTELPDCNKGYGVRFWKRDKTKVDKK